MSAASHSLRRLSGPAADEPGERRRIAAFLAGFVRGGCLRKPLQGDDQACVWERRMGWWWDENPFRREDSPLAELLEDGAGRLAGFCAYIPFDYEIDGETVPSLVTSTLFVAPGHRSAVMGILARHRKLARDFQLIDGSPSPEMRRLLGSLGFRSVPQRLQYLHPVRKGWGRPARLAVQPLGWLFRSPPPPPAGDAVTNDPFAFSPIPQRRDGRLRRRLTPESLAWLAASGSDPRRFFGLLGPDGQPAACAIGVLKRKWGVSACLLLDYADFTPRGEGMPRLLGALTCRPAASGLDEHVHLVAWSVLDEEDRQPGFTLHRDSPLHYRLPPAQAGARRACVAFEGDLPLL